MNPSSILDIVRRCQSHPGDREAFDLFYRALFPYVRLYVRVFRIPSAPLGEEDIVQDIFLKLMERFPEIHFKTETHFLGYLKSVCEHYLIDLVRKYEKQTFEELTEKLRLPAPGESPEQAAARTERWEALLRMVGTLPGTCTNLLLPFLMDGMSLAEIARSHNLPEGTVYPRFSRCVAELRRRGLGSL